MVARVWVARVDAVMATVSGGRDMIVVVVGGGCEMVVVVVVGMRGGGGKMGVVMVVVGRYQITIMQVRLIGGGCNKRFQLRLTPPTPIRLSRVGSVRFIRDMGMSGGGGKMGVVVRGG